jgi:murein endopeptidase
VLRPVLVVPALAATLAVTGITAMTLDACAPVAEDRASADRGGADRPAKPHERPNPERRIRWRRSRALGTPTAGRLVDGVKLPASGTHFVTWDPVLRRSPNRHWRRFGTDRLVRLLLEVAREHRAAHPGARPLLIGDLSRPHGGDFGIRFGPIGHASHQNGLDADIYYPRGDRARRAPRTAADIDRRRSQDIVDRFVRAGVTRVFVGPGTGLTGPPGIVQPIPNHDNHLHVRLAPG